MPTDAELRLRAVSSGFDEAKGEVDGLRSEVSGLTAEEARQTQVLADHAALLRTVTDAQAQAAASVAAMADAAAVGGAKYTAAILQARDAVAALEVAQEAVRTAGGPVSPAQIQQLAAYDAAVQIASASTASMGKSLNVSGLEMNLARGNAAGLARALGTLSETAEPLIAGITKIGLVGLVLGESLKLVIGLVEGVGKAWDWATHQLALFDSGMNEATEIIDKHGKVVDPLSDEYQKLADNAAAAERVQYALAQGFVVSTDSATKNAAAVEIAKAALHGIGLETEPVQSALKEFGLKTPPTFDAVSQAAQNFEKAYQLALAEHGSAYAYSFLEVNKNVLKQVGDGFTNLGKDVPPQIKTIADAIGLDLASAAEKTAQALAKATKAVTDLEQKQKDIQKALAESGKSFEDHTKKIEADKQAAIDAIDAQTQKTVAGLQQQVQQTQAAFDKREISADEYFAKTNQLVADQAKARDKAYDEEKAINDKAAADEKSLTDKYQTEKTRQETALKNLADAQADAEKKQAALNVQREAEVRALQAGTPLFGQSAEMAKLLADIQPKLADATSVSATALGRLASNLASSVKDMRDLTTEVKNLIPQMTALQQASIAAGAALRSTVDDSAFSGPVGSAGGDSGDAGGAAAFAGS